MGVAELLASGQLWQGRARGVAPVPSLATGWSWLDQQVGGWPPQAVTELLVDAPGNGELLLLAPALAALSQEASWQLWVAPPAIPYAPALRARGLDLSRQLMVTPPELPLALWAAEQGLASGCCSAVLAWLPQLETAQLRRLQLAAERGGCPGFIVRPQAALAQSSAAALRLQVRRVGGGLQLTVHKRRGGWPLPPVILPLAG